MSKTFTKWPANRRPYVRCKFAIVEVMAITVEEDDAYFTHGATVTEVVLRWTWTERPQLPNQFQIRFNGEGSTAIDVSQDRGNIQTYRGPGVRGATSFDLLVNQDKEAVKATWNYEDEFGFYHFTNVLHLSTSSGEPFIFAAVGTYGYYGVHDFLEVGSSSYLRIITLDTREGFLDKGELPDTGYGGYYEPQRTGGISWSRNYSSGRDHGYGDIIVDVYRPPVSSDKVRMRYIADPDAENPQDFWQFEHVWTFIFLFSQIVPCRLAAIDFGHPGPIIDSAIPDTTSNASTGETSLTAGFYAGRQS